MWASVSAPSPSTSTFEEFKGIQMANTIHVDVVSAEESIFSGQARFVALPGEAGELGVYPRHTPLITRIQTGSRFCRIPLYVARILTTRRQAQRGSLRKRPSRTPRAILIWPVRNQSLP